MPYSALPVQMPVNDMPLTASTTTYPVRTIDPVSATLNSSKTVKTLTRPASPQLLPDRSQPTTTPTAEFSATRTRSVQVPTIALPIEPAPPETFAPQNATHPPVPDRGVMPPQNIQSGSATPFVVPVKAIEIPATARIPEQQQQLIAARERTAVESPTPSYSAIAPEDRLISLVSPSAERTPLQSPEIHPMPQMTTASEAPASRHESQPRRADVPDRQRHQTVHQVSIPQHQIEKQSQEQSQEQSQWIEPRYLARASTLFEPYLRRARSQWSEDWFAAILSQSWLLGLATIAERRKFTPETTNPARSIDRCCDNDPPATALSPSIFVPDATKPAASHERETDPHSQLRTIEKIEITGSTIFQSAAEVVEIIQSPFQPQADEPGNSLPDASANPGNCKGKPEKTTWCVTFTQGKTIDLETLRQIADTITQFYLNQDYITSRAIPEAEQNFKEKTAKLIVYEGQIDRIVICPNPKEKNDCPQGNTRKLRLRRSYIRSRIRLGIDTPVKTARLEAQLRLLETEPTIKNIEANLRPTGQPGLTDLIVTITENRLFSLDVTSDNYSPPSVGSERIGMNLSYRNAIFSGDVIAGSWFRTTTGGADTWKLSYQVPLNSLNGTLQLRGAINRNEIIQAPFKDLGIRGNTEQYSLTYRQPLLRSPRQEFALAAGFSFQRGRTFIFDRIPAPFGIGPDEEGRSRTSVFHFTQEYIRRELQGTWFVRSQLNLGTALFNATTNDGSEPDSQFFSWVGQIQRSQRLSNSHLLILSASAQLSLNPLLPAQQFVIGGGQSLRGFRQNARAGDNGFRFSIEDRITLTRNAAGDPELQLVPFIDLGTIWNVQGNPNRLPDQTFLLSGGLGLIWRRLLWGNPLTLRLDYALPLIDLPDRGQNLQDNGLSFSLSYGFSF